MPPGVTRLGRTAGGWAWTDAIGQDTAPPGADRLTVAFMAASVLFANHPPPFSTLGMLAFFGAALRWDRRRQTEPVTTPLMTSGPASTSAVE